MKFMCLTEILKKMEEMPWNFILQLIYWRPIDLDSNLGNLSFLRLEGLRVGLGWGGRMELRTQWKGKIMKVFKGWKKFIIYEWCVDSTVGIAKPDSRCLYSLNCVWNASLLFGQDNHNSSLYDGPAQIPSGWTELHPGDRKL